MLTLMPLPYAPESLAPVLSKETIDYHYGRHHSGYVTMLNSLVIDTEYEKLSLIEIIQKSSKNPLDIKIYNNAAQIWNHDFYWQSFTPNQEKNDSPKGSFKKALEETFGSSDNLIEKWVATGLNQFGSGWAWLVKTPQGDLALKATKNADPVWIDTECLPLLVLDVWEHAYYIDYRNDRKKHLSALFGILNWDFAQKNWDQSTLWAYP